MTFNDLEQCCTGSSEEVNRCFFHAFPLFMAQPSCSRTTSFFPMKVVKIGQPINMSSTTLKDAMLMVPLVVQMMFMLCPKEYLTRNKNKIVQDYNVSYSFEKMQQQCQSLLPDLVSN